MKSYDIYETIKTRSGGDIYLGVVGPVRTGKSTFITKFAEKLIIPNLVDPYLRERTIDELPQSADGKTIMTTEPKFVPSKAAKVEIENVQMNVRLVDCVGYLVKGAMGHTEENKPRLVKTPWSNAEMSFKEAAELGTQKVIEEHSTVGILVTTDGSISDLDRNSYIDAEERVVAKLKQTNKPFVIVLNTRYPKEERTQILKNSLNTKYQVPVITMDVANLTLADINKMLEELLMEFPIVSFEFKMPKWLEALPYTSSFIQQIINEVKNLIKNNFKMSDYKGIKLFEQNTNYEPVDNAEIELGKGKIYFTITPKSDLFYHVLSEQIGMPIESDFELVSYLRQLTHAKQQYDKIKEALDNVKQNGYGVVTPAMNEMILAEPEMIKQGGRYGVRLKASAPSLHIMRVDIETEVSPIIGTEEQSSELVKSLLGEFEADPKSLWETKIFGKTLHSIVQEGLNHKIYAMPMDAQNKMRKTLSRIVNEGKGGIICILL
ncbi:MAG: stage IV sporulation protein A [Tenericutes bacterium HGW-Tenericutes-4]|jgi:stage IV sporulation protein A|nr:MAG: stage IV sporulation protein A [Tenericutes bacterium HGW-Tenericutes-4]